MLDTKPWGFTASPESPVEGKRRLGGERGEGCHLVIREEPGRTARWRERQEGEGHMDNDTYHGVTRPLWRYLLGKEHRAEILARGPAGVGPAPELVMLCLHGVRLHLPHMQCWVGMRVPGAGNEVGP